MSFSKLYFYFFFFFFFSFLLHSTRTNAQPLAFICGNNGNDDEYSASSTYQSNLDQVLATLAVNGSRTGSLLYTIGQIPNMVYGLVLCRGDTNASLCGSCLATAKQEVLQECLYNKSATIWYDRCLLRFSNQQLLFADDGTQQNYSSNHVSLPSDLSGRFDQSLNELFNSITNWAVFNTTKMFATGEVDNFSAELPTIYGLVQCTPELSQSQCQQCLQLSYPLPRSLVGKEAGRVLYVTCNIRFDTYKFYDGVSTLKLSPPPENNTTAPPSPQSAGAPAEEGKKKARKQVLAIALPVVAAVLLLVFAICQFFLRRKSARKLPYLNDQEGIRNLESLLFDLRILQVATAFFCEENKLGEGGFGAVYKGLLPDGREIAVKKLLRSTGEGFGELKNELVLVAKLQHRNLVRLLGVCFEEEKLLVYEYVANRSLDRFIFDPQRRKELNWETRYKIIVGIARGLLYLHEESQVRIIHRDIKASNILLDAGMNPKIADFGLARLFGDDQTQDRTRRVVGTFGYMAPEYVLHGELSVKLDIFSFGVLVLEIVTGRRNNGFLNSGHDEDLLTYTWERWTRGSISEILDPCLGGDYLLGEVSRCIQIGLLCVQEKPSNRPKMSRIILMLNSSSVSLLAPPEPAFLVGRSIMDSIVYASTSDTRDATNKQSPSRQTLLSQNEVSISELEPR